MRRRTQLGRASLGDPVGASASPQTPEAARVPRLRRFFVKRGPRFLRPRQAPVTSRAPGASGSAFAKPFIQTCGCSHGCSCDYSRRQRTTRPPSTRGTEPPPSPPPPHGPLLTKGGGGRASDMRAEEGASRRVWPGATAPERRQLRAPFRSRNTS